MSSQVTPADFLVTLGFAKRATVLAWNVGTDEPVLVTVSESSVTTGYVYEFHGTGSRSGLDGYITEWPPHFEWRPLRQEDFVQWVPK